VYFVVACSAVALAEVACTSQVAVAVSSESSVAIAYTFVRFAWLVYLELAWIVAVRTWTGHFAFVTFAFVVAVGRAAEDTLEHRLAAVVVVVLMTVGA
jgi:hypothetical protein